MNSLLQGFAALPPYGLGGLVVLLLYTVQSELRFGNKARRMSAGSDDRGSTLALSLSALVPVFGFVLAMKARTSHRSWLPAWLGRDGSFPGMPAIAWAGVCIGLIGLSVRLWAVLALRERYTRTLQIVSNDHAVERGGPYRFVRHPGYLGSLLCLNGVALASGNVWVFAISLAATFAAYAYRIRVEDRMLVERFGAQYEQYRREVPALVPFLPH